MRAVFKARPGKIAKALWLVENCPEEIEADLQRYYGVNFVDLFRPGTELTWRRFMVLFGQLPSDSATLTFIRNSIPEDELAARRNDPKRAPWSPTESLLATVVDELRTVVWMYAQAHSKAKIPRPEPIERPGVRTGRVRRFRPISELKAMDPRLRDLSDEEALAKFKELTGRG
jgi:hypothetical protein